MAVLENSKHEHFAQGIAKGLTATKAYTSAGYSAKGATQSARRMLTNARICARVAELQAELSAGVIALEIGSRNARVQALQDRWAKIRQIITERGASPEFADVPGGTTGLLVKEFKGKDGAKFKVDTGILAALLAHEKQAAEELGQWTEKREYSGRIEIDIVKAQLRVTQHRLSEEKREALAKGQPWPPT